MERQNYSNGEQIGGCQGLGLKEGCDDYKAETGKGLGWSCFDPDCVFTQTYIYKTSQKLDT